jgi:hypothetical protein
MVEFRQGFRSMAAPTRELEKLIVSKRLAHGGNPVTRWMTANVAVAQDPAGKLTPAKDQSTERIDGIVAQIMAIGRALVAQEEPQPLIRHSGCEVNSAAPWRRSGCAMAIGAAAAAKPPLEVEQPLYAQVYGLAMFTPMILEGKTPEPGTYDVVGLKSELTMEEWGPNLKVPGAVITAENVDDTRFWGNLTPPDQPVDVVE